MVEGLAIELECDSIALVAHLATDGHSFVVDLATSIIDIGQWKFLKGINNVIVRGTHLKSIHFLKARKKLRSLPPTRLRLKLSRENLSDDPQNNLANIDKRKGSFFTQEPLTPVREPSIRSQLDTYDYSIA